MTSRCVNPECRQRRLRPAYLAVAALAVLIAAGGDAGARSGRSERPIESIQSRSAGEPIMAIVSLRSQRITVYDAKGWILRAPVSSGTKGRETPAGIFSVIQKVEEHYSNLYDDAFMPHMQRITWSGIALHGGVLPGRPASHGCIRLPFDFAEHLFDATTMGMRVIVAPGDVAPVEFAHPLLFQPKPGAAALAAARTAEAQEATRKAAEARLAAGTALREATQAKAPVRATENLKRRAEAQLAAAETKLGSGISAEAKEQAEDAKAQAVAKIAELQLQWDVANVDLQLRLDAATSARDAAAAAETARVAAAEAARQVASELQPVSVLISRKTQRLYVRQAFKPVLESPVTIADPDRPIGTHVFTAAERTDRRRQIAMERRLPGRRTCARRRGRAKRPGARQQRPRRRAGADGPGQRKGRARPHHDSAGRIESHRRHCAAILPDRHRRAAEFGNRQGNGIRGAAERRAARRHQEAATQSGERIPLRAPAQPALLGLAFRKSLRLVSWLFARSMT